MIYTNIYIVKIMIVQRYVLKLNIEEFTSMDEYSVMFCL